MLRFKKYMKKGLKIAFPIIATGYLLYLMYRPFFQHFRSVRSARIVVPTPTEAVIASSIQEFKNVPPYGPIPIDIAPVVDIKEPENHLDIYSSDKMLPLEIKTPNEQELDEIIEEIQKRRSIGLKHIVKTEPFRIEEFVEDHETPLFCVNITGRDESAYQNPETTLDQAQELGFDCVVFLVTLYNDFESGEVRKGPINDAYLLGAINEAEDREMLTGIRIHVDPGPSSPYSWRGEIGIGYETRKWDNFWDSYSSLVEYYIDLTQDLHKVNKPIDILIPFSEMSTAQRHPGYGSFLRKISKNFMGSVITQNNFDNQGVHKSALPEIQYVGSNFYVPGVAQSFSGNMEELTVKDIYSHLKHGDYRGGPNPLKKILELAEMSRRKIVISEDGVGSSILSPWGCDENDKSSKRLKEKYLKAKLLLYPYMKNGSIIGYFPWSIPDPSVNEQCPYEFANELYIVQEFLQDPDGFWREYNNLIKSSIPLGPQFSATPNSSSRRPAGE